MPRVAATLVACALALAVVAAPAHAAPGNGAAEDPPEKAQARLLLAQGNALFERGDLRGALANFRAAYALYPSPKLLVNAAACERELGDFPAAANDLSAFLEEPGDDDPFLIERARNDLAQLARRLAKVSLGAGWPRGASLEIDGRPMVGLTYVRPGDHRIRVRAPRGVEVTREATLIPGDHLQIAPPQQLVATSTGGPPKRSRGWIAGVVIGVVAVGVGLGVGLGLGLPPSRPVEGDLGTLRFSDFR